MNGNTWIIIGVIAGALATFAIPYGFYRKSKDSSKTNLQISGDYVEGDKVKVEGDYINGEKKVTHQTTEIGGDFVQIGNSFHSGSTGVFVNLVLNVANFVGERTGIGESASLDEFLKWLQKQSKENLVNGHYNLLDVLGKDDEQASLIREYIKTIILLVEDQRNRLGEIFKQTELLPDMNSKLDYLIDQLCKNNSLNLRKDQVAISAKVLDILTTGIIGSGVKIMMKQKVNAHEGTAMVVWLLGTQSPHLMLLDLVGDIDTNRLSVILNEDASISLRAYDGNNHKIEVKSVSYPPEYHLVILGIWEDRNISLWINGEFQGSASMNKAFDYLGPLCLFGIDIEGKLSADASRWSPQGQDIGINFMKNGIWHGSRYDTVVIWERVLEKSEIDILAKDPWAMLR
jgi:hypothetical protein